MSESNSIAYRIVEVIPEIVIVLDRSGVIRYINHVEPGYDRDEIVGLAAESIVDPDSIDILRKALASVLSTGESVEYEVKVAARGDGQPQWYRSRMLPLFTDGEVVEVVLMATNVTEMKAAAEELAQLRRLLAVCAWCHRIRGDGGTWQTITGYLSEAKGAEVSHGLCPECYQRETDGLDAIDGALSGRG